MNKIINQESSLKLAVKGKSLVAILTLSSMLAITACGKKEVLVENNVAKEDYLEDTPKYRDRPLGGSIVDNHNRELYISKASDLESVVQGDSKNKQTSSNTQTNNKNTVTNNNEVNTSVPSQTPPQGNVVVDNQQVPAPDLLKGESITYTSDGNYVVTPPQDYVNPPQEEVPQPEQPSVGEPPIVDNPPVEDIPPVEETPPVEEQQEAYIVRKLNYSDDVYFYTFVDNNVGYDVMLTPIEYANLDDFNSNVFALAEDEEAVAYAQSEGWVLGKRYSFEEDGFKDSVYNVEQELKNRVAKALEDKQNTDQQILEEDVQSLTFTLEF